MEIQVIDRTQPHAQERAPSPPVPRAGESTAEIAECTCPDACERDHDRD